MGNKVGASAFLRGQIGAYYSMQNKPKESKPGTSEDFARSEKGQSKSNGDFQSRIRVNRLT